MKNPSKTTNPLVFKPMFPSYMRTDNHPKNKCVPCCGKLPLSFHGKRYEEDKISNEKRDEKEKEENLYFNDMYLPSNENPTIQGDTNDPEIRKLMNQWNDSSKVRKGPSFKVIRDNDMV